MVLARTVAGQAAADRARRCATCYRRHKATGLQRYAERGRASARGIGKRRIWRSQRDVLFAGQAGLAVAAGLWDASGV